MASAVYIPLMKSYVLKIAIPIYMILLLSMLWRAVSRLYAASSQTHEWSWTKKCCSLGALFFVISDSILSFDLFVHDVPYSHTLVMVTYYVAQLGISVSILDRTNEVNRSVIQHRDLFNGVKRFISSIKSAFIEDSIKLIECTVDQEQEQ